MDRAYGILSGELNKFLNYGYDDDGVDRLSHVYTVVLLILGAFIVSLKQWVGDPLECTHTNDQKFVEAICWVNSTYFIPGTSLKDNVLPPRRQEYDNIRYNSFYQWVPLILLLQAAMFYLPCLIWRSSRSRSGIDVKGIADAVCERDTKSSLDPDDKLKVIKYVAKNIDASMVVQRKYYPNAALRIIKKTLEKVCGFMYGRRVGNFLFSLYLLSKLCYLANIIIQFHILNKYLDIDTTYSWYGFALLEDLYLYDGNSWEHTGIFPRVAFCDYQIYTTGNIQTHTVLCALPLNMINEKLFIFLWFWLFLLAILNILSIIQWFFRFVPGSRRFHYVKKHLNLSELPITKSDKEYVRNFVFQYLRVDGAFLLHMIADNTNGRVCTNVTRELWILYNSRRSRAASVATSENGRSRTSYVSHAMRSDSVYSGRHSSVPSAPPHGHSGPIDHPTSVAPNRAKSKTGSYNFNNEPKDPSQVPPNSSMMDKPRMSEGPTE